MDKDKNKNNPRLISLSDEQISDVFGGLTGSKQTCPVCNGRGYGLRRMGSSTSVSGVCPRCNGTGKIDPIASFYTDSLS